MYINDTFIPLIKKNIESNVCEIEKELDSIVEFIESLILSSIEIIGRNFSMIQIMREIVYKNKGFTKLLKKLDNNYGVMDDVNVNEIKQLIKIHTNNVNIITGKSLYENLFDKNHNMITREYVLRSLCYNKIKKRIDFYKTIGVKIVDISTTDLIKKYLIL